MADILDYIDKMQQMYGDKEPSSMDQEPRNMYNQGQLVQPNNNGSRPGYSGNPQFGSKEFIKKRDMGKDIPKVRNYLDKILKKKDSITFDSIPDIKKKAGLAETSKVDADISRLLTNEYKDTVKTKGQLAKVGNAEKFRDILRDIQETIPKGKKQFINIAFTATKNKLSGNPNSGAYSRILQEPEFKNFVVLSKDVQSNPQIIRFAEEFEKLYEIQDIDKEFFGELAENIYGNKSKDSLRKISGDASKYAEFLYGVRDVTDADGRKLKLPNVEKRGDYLFELIDETLGLEEGEKGKVRPLKFGSGFERDRMFAIRDGLLGLKEGETDSQRRNIKKLLKKGYNLDEVAGLSATHEIAPGYTELVQGLKKKVNTDKMSKIDKPFARIFEQVITGQKPTKGFQYGFDKSGKPKFYQDINEVVKLYNKDATAYGKKYSIDTPLIEYDSRPGKKVNPKNFLPNFKYLSPAAQANVKELANRGIGVRTEALTMNQIQDAYDPNLKKIQIKSIAKKLDASGFKCKLANGLTCNDPRAYTQSIKENMAKVKQGDNAAIAKVNKLGKSMKAFKGVAKTTGWGLLAELGFAAPLAAVDYAKGANKDEIISNATYGLFGKSEEEQLKEKYSDYGKAQEFKKTYDDLLEAENLVKTGAGYRTQALNKLKVENLNKKLFEQSKPFNTILPPSMGFKGDFNLDKFYDAELRDQQTRDEFAKEKELTSKERGILQPSTGLEAIQLAGGGIAGLSGGDPEGAMTKSMNPDSQGLRSLIKNGNKL